MTNTTEKDDHAKLNGAGWYDTICQSVAAAALDYDRLQDLRDEREELAAAVKEAEDAQQEKDRHAAQVELNEWDAAHGAELADMITESQIDGDTMKDADEARERIQEQPLSVEVREDWKAPGSDGDVCEFRILLSTGGPALQIRGELDEHRQPSRAWLEYQDWGTGWTQYEHAEQAVLVEYAQNFYFGE